MSARPREVFYSVVTEAINDLMEHGFDSQERLDKWLEALQAAARSALIPESVLARTLRESLGQVFRRTVSGKKLLSIHQGVSEYTLAQIKPTLRDELDRRILASANLIRLNREASIQRTLQRFSGWATSIPIGGTDVQQRKKVKETIRRGIAALPFEERRVVIDQGHKLAAAINDIVATNGGAIAMIWRSHWREAGYNYRPDHKARDGHTYVLRGNWALNKGLMKTAGTKFTDEITQPGEEIFCRCNGQYLYTLRDLPHTMLTPKGRSALSAARAQLRSVSHAANA